MFKLPKQLRVLLLLVALVLLTAACRLDISVEVRVESDGAGIVLVALTADAAAVNQVPNLAEGLRLEDARDAGWTVAGPQPRDSRGVEVKASKRFESASQLPAILDELAGSGNLFSNVSLTQSRSFARTEYDFSVDVNPSPPLETFSDPEVAQLLDGHYFGRPLEELTARADPSQSLGLTLAVTLINAEGEFTSDTASVDGRTATWNFAYGDEPASVEATAVVNDATPAMWMNVFWAAVAGLGLLLVIVVIGSVVSLVRKPRGRRLRPWRRRRRSPKRQERKEAKKEKQETEAPARQRLLRLLVMDVHGVIVRPTDPLEGLLLGVIAARNPDIDPDLVRDRYRKLILGRLTPEEFWSDLGFGPISRQIETTYLSSFKLVPGLHDFLDIVKQKRLPVAVVGNQPKEWGRRLQRMADLEDSVSSWLVSGEVGAVLPEPSLLEATRRVMSVDRYDCYYLSSVEENLDAAAKMGMATAYFSASPDDATDTKHTIVKGFEHILRARATGTSQQL